MINKTRLNKLEQRATPDNNWQVPIVEVVKGSENDPDHIKRLDDLRDRAKAAGWVRGPYVVEVIKSQK